MLYNFFTFSSQTEAPVIKIQKLLNSFGIKFCCLLLSHSSTLDCNSSCFDKTTMVQPISSWLWRKCKLNPSCLQGCRAIKHVPLELLQQSLSMLSSIQASMLYKKMTPELHTPWHLISMGHLKFLNVSQYISKLILVTHSMKVTNKIPLLFQKTVGIMIFLMKMFNNTFCVFIFWMGITPLHWWIFCLNTYIWNP